MKFLKDNSYIGYKLEGVNIYWLAISRYSGVPGLSTGLLNLQMVNAVACTIFNN